MASLSSSSKTSYIYDQQTDTWYPLSGIANTAANYVWSGTHRFDSATTFYSSLIARAGLNNFQNPAARDAAIPSPTNGIVCFVRQNSTGTQINELQYYFNSGWVNLLSGNAATATFATTAGTATTATSATSATTANTAAALTTARTINAVSFNGTANIKVPGSLYVDSSNNYAGNRRVIVKNTTTPPSGSTPIDGVAPQLGDIFIGW
jgi:hypothetical protein